jgi:hypothetical protein
VAVSEVTERQVYVDIAVAFVVSVPASVDQAGVESSGHPRFPAFPSVDHFAIDSSSVEIVG